MKILRFLLYFCGYKLKLFTLLVLVWFIGLDKPKKRLFDFHRAIAIAFIET